MAFFVFLFHSDPISNPFWFKASAGSPMARLPQKCLVRVSQRARAVTLVLRTFDNIPWRGLKGC